jgi:hypothetical protein
MDQEKALEIIKGVLDAATKSGVFPNFDASYTAAVAWNIIVNKISSQKNEEHG